MPEPTQDALSLLEEFSFRGTKYPITSETAGFRNENAQHKVQLGSVTIVQPLGAQSWSFEYSIPMRNGVMSGPYTGLFQKIVRLATDCRLQTKGKLVSPVWGEWMVQCTEFSGTIEANRRDGADAKVSFIESPDEETNGVFVGGVQGLQGLIDQAGELDILTATVFAKREKAPPEPTVNPLDAISGFLRGIEHNGQKIAAALNQFAYKCEKVESAAQELIRQTRDGELFGIVQAARRNRRNAYAAKELVESSGRTVVDITTNSAILVGSLALEAGTTVKDLILLNPTLAKNPRIPKGTKVRTYAQ